MKKNIVLFNYSQEITLPLRQTDNKKRGVKTADDNELSAKKKEIFALSNKHMLPPYNFSTTAGCMYVLVCYYISADCGWPKEQLQLCECFVCLTVQQTTVGVIRVVYWLNDRCMCLFHCCRLIGCMCAAPHRYNDKFRYMRKGDKKTICNHIRCNGMRSHTTQQKKCGESQKWCIVDKFNCKTSKSAQVYSQNVS